MKQTFISVIMPLYNEERYIEDCIKSLLLQNYPKECMEWIFVDGYSEDQTREIVKKYRKKYPNLIKLLDNPYKTVPYAMNIGIKQSKGKYLIRLDAHADYATDYISKCVFYLSTMNIENVGGLAETKGKKRMGNIIAKMLSSKFGVGNSRFRTKGKSGFVDTVPFGAFKREVFEKYGGYDEQLTRNEDNEMNYRIRKNGGKIYLADDIHFSYYCRDSIKDVCNMAIKNGTWNIIAMKLYPGSMGIRHFVPLFFVLSILLLPIVGLIFKPMIYWLGVEIFIYLILDIYYSIRQSNKIVEFGILLLLFPTFHISYGIGSILGLLKLFTKF